MATMHFKNLPQYCKCQSSGLSLFFFNRSLEDIKPRNGTSTKGTLSMHNHFECLATLPFITMIMFQRYIFKFDNSLGQVLFITCQFYIKIHYIQTVKSIWSIIKWKYCVKVRNSGILRYMKCIQS